MKTNIKINYMLLEQILRVTGTYKNICDEHEFLDVIFKQAKTGDIDTLFRNEEAKETALEIIENITGVSAKYWAGDERIKLGIRCKNEKLNDDDSSIDTVDLENDEKYISEEGEGHAYHGILYQEQLKNPLHLDYEELYSKVFKIELDEDGEDKGDEQKAKDNAVEEAVKIIEELYSLRGLLTVILLNMGDEIELIDKANVYRHKSWEPYIRTLKRETQNGITYSPKYIEMRKGVVQTIIKNIYDLGIVFTFRDLDKDFTI